MRRMGRRGKRGYVYFEHYDVCDGHDWCGGNWGERGMKWWDMRETEVIMRYYSQDQTYTVRKEWPVTLGENYSSGSI